MNTEKEIIASLRTLGGHLRKGLGNQKSSEETDKKIRQAIAEEVYAQNVFREFSKIVRLDQDANGNYIIVELEMSRSKKSVEAAISGMKQALSDSTRSKKTEIPEKLISYCVERFIDAAPRSKSLRRSTNARFQIEVSVRKSLRRFSHLLSKN
jgi:hypothetical protein